MKKLWGIYVLLACQCLVKNSYAQEYDYSSVGAIANACYESLSSSPSAQALVDQTFIRLQSPVHEQKLKVIPQQVITVNELSSRMRDLRHDITATFESEQELADRSTQIYISQTLYNWMVFERTFQNLQTGQDLSAKISSLTFQHPKVQQVFSDVASIFDGNKDKIRNLSSKENLKDEIERINPIIMQVNKVCKDRHSTYKILKNAYQSKANQNFDFNPGLEKALYPNGIPDVITLEGDLNAILRNRMRQELNAVTEEASLYRFILSQTSMGYFLNTKTDLQDYVGKWNVQKCLEEGRQLNTISDQAELLIPHSLQQVRLSYQSALTRISTNQDQQMMGEVYVGKTSREIVEQYVQENPTSIQMALLSVPNDDQALRICSLIQGIKTSGEMREALQPLIVIGATLASAFVGPEMLLLINASWLTTSVADLAHSYGMEDRISQAILSHQIPALYGQEMIQNLQNQRPYSYLNLALATAGTAVSVKSVQNSMKIKAYNDQLSTRGGSTEAKFNSVQSKNILTSQQKTTTTNVAGKLTSQEVTAIENWLKKQPLKTEGTINGTSKNLTKSNDLDLFTNDLDGGAGVFTKPKLPTTDGSIKTVSDLLQGTGVTTSNKLGFAQPKTQKLSFNHPVNNFGFQNKIQLDPVSRLVNFPITILNVQPIQSVIGSEEQRDEILRLKDFLDELLSRDSNSLTKEERDALCNLLKNGIHNWLKTLLDIVLDKYASSLDCINTTKIMFVEKSSKSYKPKVVIEYDKFGPYELPIPFHSYSEAMQQLLESKPIVINQAKIGDYESEPTTVPEAVPEEGKPTPNLIPGPSEDDPELNPPGQADPLLPSKNKWMSPNPPLPPVPYAIPHGYINYQTNTWMGDPIPRKKLEELRKAVKEFYEQTGSNGESVFQRALKGDRSEMVVQEMKRLDELCMSASEREKPSREICNFVYNYLYGRKNIKSPAEVYTGPSYEVASDDILKYFDLRDVDKFAPNIRNQLIDLIQKSEFPIGRRQNAEKSKLENILYALNELQFMSHPNLKIEYLQKVIASNGEDILRSDSDIVLSKFYKRLPLMVEAEVLEMKNLFFNHGKELHPISVSNPEEGKYYKIKFLKNENVWLNITLLDYLIINEHIHPVIKVKITPIWESARKDVNGFIYMQIRDEFGNNQLMVFLHPKYSYVDIEAKAKKYLLTKLSQEQLDSLEKFIINLASDKVNLGPTVSNLKATDYILGLWRTIYAAMDMREFIIESNKVSQDGSLKVDYHTNLNGLLDQLEGMQFTKDEIMEIYAELETLGFFLNENDITLNLSNFVVNHLGVTKDGDLSLLFPQYELYLQDILGSIDELLTLKDKNELLKKLLSMNNPEMVTYFLQKLSMASIFGGLKSYLNHFLSGDSGNVLTVSDRRGIESLQKIYQSMEKVKTEELPRIEQNLSQRLQKFYDHRFFIEYARIPGQTLFLDIEEAKKNDLLMWIPVRNEFDSIFGFYEIELQDYGQQRLIDVPLLDHVYKALTVDDENAIQYLSRSYNDMNQRIIPLFDKKLRDLVHGYQQKFSIRRILSFIGKPDSFDENLQNFLKEGHALQASASAEEYMINHVLKKTVLAYDNLENKNITDYIQKNPTNCVFIVSTTHAIPVWNESVVSWIIPESSKFNLVAIRKVENHYYIFLSDE